MSVRASRPQGYWKRKAFARLVERDGAFCSECRAEHRTIWRQMGCWSGGVAHGWGRYTKVHPTSNLEVDHRLPLSQGGANDDDNLWLLCVECHKRKTSSERSSRLKALFAAAREA